MKFQTKQDAPGVIKYVRILERTDTTVVLSWQEPEEKNGVIQKYTVTYELINQINCDEKPIWQNETMSVSPSMISKVTISGLQPYSIYNITVAAETILPGTPLGIQGNTTIINDISEEELPDTISASNLSARSVTIRWPMNCLKQRGPLYFQIVLMCVQDEWCDQTQDIVLNNISSRNGGGTTYELTPFTHYSVELRAKRSQSEDLTTISRTLEIYSPLGNPPAVRIATDYSRDSVSISIRWLDPYPPHGHLEKYAIKYCYRTDWGCKTTEITSKQLAPCDLWNEHFNCYKITDLYTNYQYTITILAKNRDIKLWSPDTILKVNTTEDKSSAPLNLTREWEHNEIKLSGNHPNITNGRLKKFIITLIQNETKLKNQDGKPFYSYEHIVSEDMKTYSYKINKIYQYSSSYIVTVCGVNSVYGENATLYIDTPPETPELNGDVVVDEKTNSNSTVTVIIPGFTSAINSTVRFLYVVVSKINSTCKINSDEGSNLKRDILKFTTFKLKWIAKEISVLNENKFKVIIGSGESTKSQQLNETILNYNLEPSTDYEVTFVLLNMYKNENRTKVYRLNVRTASIFRPEFYALFVILLPIIIVAIFLYFRYRTKSTSGSTNNSKDVKKKLTESDYGYLEPRKLNWRHTYLEIVDNEPVYSTPDLAPDIQDKSLVEEHIYETIIYSTKNPSTSKKLLSKDAPIDEEQYMNL